MNPDLEQPVDLTLTQGQISTILYVLEGYVQGNDDYANDPTFANDINSIFKTLETLP